MLIKHLGIAKHISQRALLHRSAYILAVLVTLLSGLLLTPRSFPLAVQPSTTIDLRQSGCIF